MRIKCLYFAAYREITDKKEELFDLEKTVNSKEFIEIILIKYPGLEKLIGKSVLAINQEYIDRNAEVTLKEGDEIAFIPPISGG